MAASVDLITARLTKLKSLYKLKFTTFDTKKQTEINN